MAEGLTKKELEKARDDLILKIDDLEREEETQSGQAHKAVAEKLELKYSITTAKREKDLYEKLIEECKDISHEASATRG